MTPKEIQKRIEERIPAAEVRIRDLTGTADHWEVTVIAGAFRGKSILDQHRLVKDLFRDEIASGSLHAFSLKTLTPE